MHPCGHVACALNPTAARPTTLASACKTGPNPARPKPAVLRPAIAPDPARPSGARRTGAICGALCLALPVSASTVPLASDPRRLQQATRRQAPHVAASVKLLLPLLQEVMRLAEPSCLPRNAEFCNRQAQLSGDITARAWATPGSARCRAWRDVPAKARAEGIA